MARARTARLAAAAVSTLAGAGLLASAPAAVAAPAAQTTTASSATSRVTIGGRTFEHRTPDPVLLTRLQAGTRARAALRPTAAAATGPVVRVAGADRYATAVAASQALYAPDAGLKADAVVLARGDAFPDALAAQGLARSEGTSYTTDAGVVGVVPAPLLLTRPGALPETTSAEITRVLEPGGRVHIVGGESAVSASIASELADAGYVVDRVAGRDRYETAVDAAVAQLRSPTSVPGLVVVADGSQRGGGADALAASSAIGGLVADAALVLTDGDQIPLSTRVYLDLLPSSTRVVGVGGAVAKVPSDWDATVYGADRYATATAVAQYFFETRAVDGPLPATACLARGDDFADALAGGSLCSTFAAPVLLTRPASLPSATSTYLAGVTDTLHAGVVLGGTSAVSDQVATDFAGYVSRPEA